MLCELCKKNEASVHITKILNGNKQEFNLCEKCAKEKGEFSFYNTIEGSSPFTFQNILSGIIEHIDNTNEIQKNSHNYCENCGTTYSEFKQKGLVGCSECYKNLNNTIIPIIKRVQGNIQHAGKIPRKLGRDIIEKKKLLTLKEDLQNAIASEEYEKAAEIRDMIKKIQNQ
jgi:protein arginine kinase activator